MMSANQISADNVTVGTRVVTAALDATGSTLLSGSTTTISSATTTLSGTNTTLSGELRVSTTNSITAYAGGGQANATQLSGTVCRITTCATSLDSVKLPATPAAGQRCLVIVDSTCAAGCAVYPGTGDAIDALSANAYIVIHPGSTQEFVAVSASQWYTTIHGMRFILRQATATDLEETSMTADNSFYDWDISALIPPAAYGMPVHVQVRVTDESAKVVTMRPNGGTHTVGQVEASVTGDAARGVIITKTDASGVLEYRISAATVTDCNFTVVGYWVQG